MNLNDDLFEKINQSKNYIQSTKKEIEKSTNMGKGRSIDVKVLKYEICDSDPDFVSIIKTMVNSSKIKNTDLYEYFGRSKGYNMLYSLKNGSLSWERAKDWANFLGYELEIVARKINK